MTKRRLDEKGKEIREIRVWLVLVSKFENPVKIKLILKHGKSKEA